MTKRELVKELHRRGEMWANESYPKRCLQDYLNGLKEASKMSDIELARAVAFAETMDGYGLGV